MYICGSSPNHSQESARGKDCRHDRHVKSRVTLRQAVSLIVWMKILTLRRRKYPANEKHSSNGRRSRVVTLRQNFLHPEVFFLIDKSAPKCDWKPIRRLTSHVQRHFYRPFEGEFSIRVCVFPGNRCLPRESDRLSRSKGGEDWDLNKNVSLAPAEQTALRSSEHFPSQCD